MTTDYYPADGATAHPGDATADQRAPHFNPSASAQVAETGDGPRDVGIVFVGDSFISGYGDPKGQGWVSRVIGRTPRGEVDVTAYNLGIRGDSSGDILNRWRTECPPRWTDRAERRLVIGVGANDVAQGMSTARSRLNLANILDDAAAIGISTFVVGPPPALDDALNDKLEIVVDAQADVCNRRRVPYVDCFAPLLGHEQWSGDLAASPDGVHPGQAGYGLLAWLVLHGGWGRWLRIAE